MVRFVQPAMFGNHYQSSQQIRLMDPNKDLDIVVVEHVIEKKAEHRGKTSKDYL